MLRYRSKGELERERKREEEDWAGYASLLPVPTIQTSIKIAKELKTGREPTRLETANGRSERERAK